MLGELFTRHGSDKETQHGYASTYEVLLGPRRAAVRNLLEVGIARGASLRAWAEYLPDALVWGMDLSSELVQEPRIVSRRADSRVTAAVAAALGDARFDVIVDDGDHHPDAQHKTREVLWPYLLPGGLYVVEDVQWQDSHPGFTAAGGTIVDLRHLRPDARDSVLAVFHKEKDDDRR
jgi:hypothetical protein